MVLAETPFITSKLRVRGRNDSVKVGGRVSLGEIHVVNINHLYSLSQKGRTEVKHILKEVWSMGKLKKI